MYKDVLQMSLKHIVHVGFLTKKPHKIFLKYAYSILHVFFLVLITMGFFMEGYSIPYLIESFMSTIQILAKIVTLMYFQDELFVVLDEMKTFYSFEEMPEQYQKPIQKVNNLVYLVYNCYKCTSVCNYLLFMIKPFISEKRQMCMTCYVPNNVILNFWSLYFTQSIWIYLCAQMWLGFDIMFAALCGNLIYQCKILQFKFSNLDFKNRKLGMLYLNNHNLIVR